MPALSNLTYFKNWSKAESENPLLRTLDIVEKRIRTGASQAKIEALRSLTETEAIKTAKDDLVCIMFQGEFTYRNKDSITRHSGLAIFDFDSKPEKGIFISQPDVLLQFYKGIRLETPVMKNGKEPKEGHYAVIIDDAEALRDCFKTIPYVVMAFVSPSGKGVKVVVRIPVGLKTYEGHYEALLREFVIADTTSKNIGRVCYESYDPNIFFRPFEEAIEYTNYIETQVPAVQAKPAGHVAKVDYSLLNKACATVRMASDGERHDFLMKAATLVGGYISAGYLPEEIAVQALVDAFSERPYDTDYRPERNIRDGIAHGKMIPIYNIPEQVSITNTDGNQIDVVVPPTKKTTSLVSVNDVWPEMEEQFINGAPRGKTTFFTGLDSLWTLLPGEKTLFTGSPGEGKTELVKQIQVAQSLFCGTKWACFSPEDGTVVRYFNSIIEMLVGLPADVAYSNRMNGVQYADAAQWVNEHFFFLDLKSQKTHKNILAEFKYAIEYLGVTGIVEDPFNRIQLQSKFLRDDERISEYMDEEQNFSLLNNVYSFTTLHPKTEGMRLNDQGEYPQIGTYQLAGGAMWSNKTDNLTTTYRPHRQNNPKDRTVHFSTLKIKLKKTVGDEGTAKGLYDYWQRRHFFGGQNPLNSPDNPFDAISARAALVGSKEEKAYSQSFPEGASSFGYENRGYLNEILD